MYTSLLLLLAGSGSDSALDANTTERIGPSSRVLPRCNVHVFEPVHKTSTKSRQGGSTESQYDVFSRIAPRVNSTPRSSADWILFGSDLTFRDAHRYPVIRELTKLAANSTDYRRVALWSGVSSLGSNLDLWRRWSAEQVRPMMEYARTVGKLLDYDAEGAEQALREVCRRVRIGRGPESAIGGRVYG